MRPDSEATADRNREKRQLEILAIDHGAGVDEIIVHLGLVLKASGKGALHRRTRIESGHSTCSSLRQLLAGAVAKKVSKRQPAVPASDCRVPPPPGLPQRSHERYLAGSVPARRGRPEHPDRFDFDLHTGYGGRCCTGRGGRGAVQGPGAAYVGHWCHLFPPFIDLTRDDAAG